MLGETEVSLSVREKELDAAKRVLSEETTMRKAHQETEEKLRNLCEDLKKTLTSITADLHGYQDKIGMTSSKGIS